MRRLQLDLTPLRRFAVVAGTLGLSLLSCGRELTGPEGGIRFASGLSFLAQYPEPLASVVDGAGSVVPFERVRVVFRRSDGTVALDTSVVFPSNADSIALDLRVPLSSSASPDGESLALTLAYVNAAGDTVFRGGPVPVVAQVRAPGSPPPAPAPVPLLYTGPGSEATAIAFSVESLTVVAGDPFSFTATARDAQGAVVSATPIVYSALDPVRATLVARTAGNGNTTSSRGIARILAQLPSGDAADTAYLVVLPRPGALTLVSGGAQTAATGAALAQPVSVRLVATDGQPLAGIAVGVTATSGGGGVVALDSITDAQGLFSFSWTLGGAAGAQTATVTAQGVTPLVVSATAEALAATQVVITQQVGSTYQAGDSIPALLAEVRLGNGARDTLYSDSVFLGFAVNPTGATLSGDTRVRAIAGIARFDNFRITRAGTGYRLLVGRPGLDGDTSATIDVTARAASALALVSGGGQSAAPGAALAQPIIVRVADGYDNPVAGFVVSFAPVNGTASAAADTTDADGLASVNWTLATLVGAQTLTVTAPGLTGSPLPVNANGSAGIATTSVAPLVDTLTAVGATRVLVATSRDGANAVQPGLYTWISRDAAIASVNDSGRVQAVANGATWVVVTESGGTRDSARIVVEQRLATIRVTPDPRTIYLGASFQFAAQAVDGLGVPLTTQPTFTWTTASGSIASISAGGVATGLGLGATQVRATSGAVTGVASLSVLTPITRIAVVRDSATFVVSDTFSLAALQQTRSYRAVAYDTLDVVMPGITFAWASSNPSVATLDSVGTATARAQALANGFTAVRASAQGVVGTAALTVAQVMTAVELTPSSASVAPLGAVVLTARRRDANGFFIPGGSFTFASNDVGIATVSATGVVTGVAIGGTTVTATSGTITSPPSTITVTESVPAIISFGRDTVAIGRSAVNAVIPVYLSRPNTGQAVTVNLAVADTFAYFSPVTVTIAAGQTAGAANLNGRSAGTTRIFATDGSGTNYAGDTAVLAVQASVRFTTGSYTLLVNDEVSTQVLLTDPSPAGGTFITYAFGTPGRATVSPDPAFIPAGQLAANVVIRATSAGSTTITPAATGVTGTASTVNATAAVLTLARPVVRVGAGQFRNDWYVYSPLSVNTPVAVTLTSSDSTAVRVEPQTVTIPAGTNYVYFTTRGLQPGAVNITASATGWTSSTLPFAVTSPRVGISGGGTLNTTNPEFTLTAYAEDSTGGAHWRSSALSVAVSSSDTAVMRVLTPSIVIGEGQYFSSTIRAIPGGTPGTAWIRVTASGHAPDSVQYTTVGPNIRVNLGWPRVGAGQYRPDNYVYTPNSVTAPLVVRLTSSAAGVATVADSVIIPANTNIAYFTTRGLTPGTTRINVTAAGYQPDSVNFLVTTPKTYLSGGGTFNNFAPPVAITVISSDTLNGGHYRTDSLIVALSSSDTSVVTVTPFDTLAPGDYFSQGGRVSFVGVGTAWVRAEAPGHRPDSVLYTVVQPRLQFSFTTYTIGRRQYRLPTDFYVYTPNNPVAPLAVTISQSNPTADSLTATALTIPSTLNYAYFGLAGLQNGVDTLIATAPGYLPDTAFVRVTSPRLAGGTLPGAVTTTTPPQLATIYAADSVGGYHYSLDTMLFVARTSNAAVLQPDSVAFRLPRGAYFVQPRTRFVGPGTGTMTWVDSLGTGYDSITSNTVTVTGPSLTFTNSYPVLGMRQHRLGTGAYVSIPNVIGSPLVVRLVSTDPAVATVPDSVIIPVGLTYAYVDIRAQDVVGTVQLQATALGYTSAVTTQQVTAPRFIISTTPTVRTTQLPTSVSVQAADANGNAHYVWEPVTVTLTSSAPGIATIDSASVVIAAGNYINTAARLTPLTPGTTQITASDARIESYRYSEASITVSVTLPALAWSQGASPLRLGVGQWADPYPYRPDYPTSPLTVTLTHSSGASSSPATAEIPASNNYVYTRVTGVSVGVDTITFSAPGHVSVRGAVSVGLGRVDPIGGWPTTLATDSVLVTLYARDMDGNVRNVAAATTFDLAIAGTALDAAIGGVAVTSVTIPANAQSVSFHLRRVANGTATVTFTNANYSTHVSPTVTVTGAP
jgi:hypothetical protein